VRIRQDGRCPLCLGVALGKNARILSEILSASYWPTSGPFEPLHNPIHWTTLAFHLVLG
jgi:hypothetical protein